MTRLDIFFFFFREQPDPTRISRDLTRLKKITKKKYLNYVHDTKCIKYKVPKLIINILYIIKNDRLIHQKSKAS